MYRTWISCCLVAGLALTMGGCPQDSEAPGKETAAQIRTAGAAEPDESSAPGKPAASTRPPTPAKPVDKPIYVRAGLATPESALYDAARDLYLVANINGAPLAQDGNGYISLITPDGAIKAGKWIEGGKQGVTLNAPKGMALYKDRLFVADITHVRIFDRNSGAPRGAVRLPGATFVNDLAAGEDGTIYASDSGEATAAIWTFKGDADKPEPRALIKGKQLGRPNGLTVDGEALVVVTLGSGELYRVSKAGKRSGAVKAPTGGLDGVVRLPGGDLLISSWEGKKVYRVDRTGAFSAVVKGVRAPADIGFDSKRKRILVPLFMDNHLLILPL